MTQNSADSGANLRSARWFRKNDLPGFIHRSTLAVDGWSRDDLMQRPVIGILNTWSDLNPCNLSLRTLAVKVREGILAAGGIPLEVPLMSISENLVKPTSFPFRNLLAMEAEESIRAYPLDAVVLLSGCDKTQPALLMGAASADVPAIFLNSGPATPRSMSGGALATRMGSGNSSTRCARATCPTMPSTTFERNVMGSPGHCAEMGTASPCRSHRGLGVGPPGQQPGALHGWRRGQFARLAGQRAVELAQSGGPRPGDPGPPRLRQRHQPAVRDRRLHQRHHPSAGPRRARGRAPAPRPLRRDRTQGSADCQCAAAGEHLTERLMMAGGVPPS